MWWENIKTGLKITGMVCVLAALPFTGFMIGGTITANVALGAFLGMTVGGLLDAGLGYAAYRHFYADADEAEIRRLRSQIQESQHVLGELRQSRERLSELQRQYDLASRRTEEISQMRDAEHAARQQAENERAQLVTSLVAERVSAQRLLREFTILRQRILGVQERVAADEMSHDELNEELQGLEKHLRHA